MLVVLPLSCQRGDRVMWIVVLVCEAGLERDVLWVEGKWEVEGCGRWRYVWVVRLRGDESRG